MAQKDERRSQRRPGRLWLVVLLLGVIIWQVRSRRGTAATAEPGLSGQLEPAATPAVETSATAAETSVPAASPSAAFEPSTESTPASSSPASAAATSAPEVRAVAQASSIFEPVAPAPAESAPSSSTQAPLQPHPAEGPHSMFTPAPSSQAASRPDRPSPTPRRRKPAPSPRAEDLPRGAVAALPDGEAPDPEYTIKATAGSRLFHPPASPYFRRTRAEFWFRKAEDARAAGFTEWTPKKRSDG
jgi:cytoskeletal protein RodZ